MMSEEKQIEEIDEMAYDCDECEHFRVCYKIHQYHVHQINAGLYCPSFKRKQIIAEWVLEHETYGKMICSNCKEEAPTKTVVDRTYTRHILYDKKHFCSNCGAKMKGAYYEPRKAD